MDVLSFINSSAIREYLRNIGYKFEQNEIAWLIWQCKSISFDEKKDAWNQLMEEYQDSELQKRCNLAGCSLFQAIRKYEDMYDGCYQKFLEDEAKAVYSYQFYCPGDMSFCEEFDTIYSSYEKCWNAIKEDMDLGMTRIIIRKEYIDDESGKIEVEFKQDKSNQWVVYDISSYGLSDKEIQVECFFEEMYFEFPVPFIKGDIIYIPQFDSPYFEEDKSAFVFEKLCAEDYNAFLKENGDSSDMRVAGYFPDDDGSIFIDGAGNYIDMEYYDKPLTRMMRIVKTISSFKKGEIDIDLVLAAYKKFTMEELSKENVSSMYLDEWRVKAGIISEKETSDNGTE